MAVRRDENGRKVPAHIYSAEAIRCAACREKERVAAEFDGDTSGLYFTVTKTR